MISDFGAKQKQHVTFVDNISVDKKRLIIFLSRYDKIPSIPLPLKSSYAIWEN